MTEFEWSLKNGHTNRMVNPAYLEYLRTMPCSACGAPPRSDPHHLIGHGFGGMGTKSGDDMAFPLCRSCHESLHHDMPAWEERNGSQWKHVTLALMQFIRDARSML